MIDDYVSAALQTLDWDRVVHPDLGVQERVLCYELYHCLRRMEEKGDLRIAPAVVHGELSKVGQRYFPGRQAVPDLLFHEPGSNEYNIAVLEAKRAKDLRSAEVLRDIEKLSRFRTLDELHYSEAIFLVVGHVGDDLDRWRRFIEERCADEGVEVNVLLHDAAAGETARLTIRAQ